jgi:hypothetical protein
VSTDFVHAVVLGGLLALAVFSAAVERRIDKDTQ